jgi:hypothetical protein
LRGRGSRKWNLLKFIHISFCWWRGFQKWVQFDIVRMEAWIRKERLSSYANASWHKSAHEYCKTKVQCQDAQPTSDYSMRWCITFFEIGVKKKEHLS